MQPLANYLRQVQKLLRQRGATPEHAEELVQEAVLRLHVYTREGGKIVDREAFLMRTVLNLAVDAHRRGHGDRYEPDRVEDLDLVDLAPSADEVLQAEQRLLRYKEALDQVSERTREIFFMHRLQGFTHAEIAHRLGISVSAVEKHVASAVTVLAIERQRESG
jgi:RNA polymerase sigma factor (sigma-70 family)